MSAISPIDFAFHDCAEADVSFHDALIDGLSRETKAIPCRFLYDRRGSQLFDKICTLPEYYPTRTEIAIYRAHAKDLAAIIGPRACLIELGSGSSVKTRILLDALPDLSVYMPIDVSREYLRGAASSLAKERPGLKVAAICADYGGDFALPAGEGRRVGFLPGSTIGNLTTREAIALLRNWRARLGDDGLMIIGADAKKSPAMLEAAYNDSAGVTERFIKNVLVRANRELGADFEPGRFAYEAFYVERLGRVEMHLRSLGDQTVRVGPDRFAFADGERVHVENSHKYDIDKFAVLARRAGFTRSACFTDPAQLFSVQVLQPL